MSALRKLVVFVVVVSVAVAIERAWLGAVQPQIATRVAIEQLNGNDGAFRQLRLFETFKGVADGLVIIVAIAVAWWLASKPQRNTRSDWPQLMGIGALALLTMSGCIRAYDTPEYAEINTSETGFPIPLEGSEVMDSEVRGRIQQISAEVAARYPLDALRARKQEISDAVKTDVTTFFAQRGVVITTAGMFGGMTYENTEIQKAIDNTIIAQQLKVVNEARWEAQQRDNDRVTLEANAVAERARHIAAGEADAKKIAADAEAQSIREVTHALAEAQQNPLLYQLRALEVERARVEHWNGQYPSWFSGTAANSPNLMLQMPAPPR